MSYSPTSGVTVCVVGRFSRDGGLGGILTNRNELIKSVNALANISWIIVVAFCKGENQPITRIQAYRIINDACAIAKIKGAIGTHTLRKTFGYWAYKQGIDITLLMKIFNHSAPSITLRYIGITQEDINNVYVNLNL